jgi:hypothetical protein
VSVFQNAECDLDMGFEDTLRLWGDMSDSKSTKDSLTILKLVNELLNSILPFRDICEVASDLASGRKSFTDIQNEWPIILNQYTVDNFSTQLRQKK